MVVQKVKTWDKETGSISALTPGCSKSVLISDPKIKVLLIPGIKQGADTHPVAGNKQFLLFIVPDGKYKLAVQPVQTIWSIVDVGI